MSSDPQAPFLKQSDPVLAEVSVVDLFCGAGGLSYGFACEGFSVAAGVDLDDSCRYAFETNNHAPFFCRDVAALQVDELGSRFQPGTRRVLIGCAPCQPYSPYSRKADDPKWHLLTDFGRLAVDLGPEVVSMENVPHLLTFRQGKPFKAFVKRLEEAHYRVAWDTLYGPAYGLPQTRTRLVLIASRLGPVTLPNPTHAPEQYPTVDETIGELEPIPAGGKDARDPLHRARNLSSRNLERIRHSRPGGTWHDWPEHLITPCHRRRSGRTFGAVYGRMVGDEPGPTLTTQFFGYGSGRFGHPTQDRALSLREGALLQGFPPEYAFVAPEDKVTFERVGRMIGNAVPVTMARAVARAVKAHLHAYP